MDQLIEAYEAVMGDSIKYQGSLEKQGRLKTWSWKKYWFVLQDDQLCYFKDEKVISFKEPTLTVAFTDD